MDITYIAYIGRLKYVQVVVETYSSIVRSMVQSKQRPLDCSISTLKTAMLYIGVPFDLKTPTQGLRQDTRDPEGMFVSVVAGGKGGR